MDNELKKRSIKREFKRIDQEEFGYKANLGTKKCTLCKCVKEIIYFFAAPKYKDGYYKHCKKCHYEVYVRDSHFRRTYGITQVEYTQLVDKQNGKCLTCGIIADNSRAGRLVIDHCHTNGGIRGLICQGCNRALGDVHDNSETLRNLANYLDEYYANI